MEPTQPVITPTPANPKESFFSIGNIIALIVLFLILGSIPVSLTLIRRSQEAKKSVASGKLGILCFGGGKPNEDGTETYYGLLDYHTFANQEECLRAESNGMGPNLVGELKTCQNAGNTCVSAANCTTSKTSCNISADIPSCSVAQLDCLNAPWTGSGGHITAGGIGFNCDCPAPPTTPPTTPPTLPPTFSEQCNFLGAFDSNWNPITDLSTLQVGQALFFATSGATDEPQGITKARFRINGGDWQEATTKHDNNFYIEYTIPADGSYTIESSVFNPTLGWQ